LFLREWRKSAGLTQQALADRLGTTKSVISELETGAARWHRDHLTEIAFAIGCEPEDLLKPGPQPLEPIRLVWEKIPEESRAQALKVLESFLRTA
jgi:transcriptional regulator with XRE-family HTH domain